MQNFNFPYFSKSVSEFWRRWHMSLSFWIHDYLYLPLAVTARNWGVMGVIYALIVSFTLCGIWHGASWHYVFFGFLQGAAISCHVVTRKLWPQQQKFISPLVSGSLGVLATFSFWCFSLIFFRALTMSDAFYIVKHIVTDIATVPKKLYLIIGLFRGLSLSRQAFTNTICLLCVFIAIEYLTRKEGLIGTINRCPVAWRWASYYLIVMAILFYGAHNVAAEFIYFQF